MCRSPIFGYRSPIGKNQVVAVLQRKRIGNFDIIQLVGRGGMGTVYKAWDNSYKRFVAVKFLPDHLMQDRESRDRFRIEAAAAGALDHRYVCTLYDIQQVDSHWFLVMEFVDGPTLKEYNAVEVLSGKEIFRIGQQVATGLSAAHEVGVIHRDLKLTNIMLTSKREVRLVDFGLAKLRTHDITDQESTVGTVSYMSPEQTRGRNIDHRTDIWSLGVVMSELLDGVKPFGGAHDQAIIFNIRNDKPVPLAPENRIPQRAHAIVEKCLRKDPAARYQSAAELADALADVHNRWDELNRSRWERIKQRLARLR